MLLAPITVTASQINSPNLFAHSIIAVLSGLLLLTSLFSNDVYATEIYTWVDEHGVTHFSQEPPEQKQVKKIYSEDIKPAKIGTVSPKATAKVISEPTELEKSAIAINKSDKAQAKVICENAKHSLNVLTSHSKLNKQSKESGESVAMTEEQRQTAIKEQKQRVSLFCAK
ncbi:DUF4124 domain-containing protein [Shewanella kaireitica]|uniref:DUF4124 domain-containing protein n=1 Tax=Shewanella kaireitica TaxID=212021 RepID=UPI00200DBA98|nr:DUF4124 domain-containing protein [Shewanella kaireitica]MCL1092624.1 DUF4124 domain-containing protein [Shewanella kaireitica]